MAKKITLHSVSFNDLFVTSIRSVDQLRNSPPKTLTSLRNRGRLRSERKKSCPHGLFTNKSERKCRLCGSISLSRRKISDMQFVRHVPVTFPEEEALNVNIGHCHRWMSSYFPIGRWQSTTRISAFTDVRPIHRCILVPRHCHPLLSKLKKTHTETV